MDQQSDCSFYVYGFVEGFRGHPLLLNTSQAFIRRSVHDEDLARPVQLARSTDFNPGRPKSRIAVWIPDVRSFNVIGSGEKAQQS